MTSYMTLVIQRENGAIITRKRLKNIFCFKDLFYDILRLECMYINKKGKMVSRTYAIRGSDEFEIYTELESETIKGN